MEDLSKLIDNLKKRKGFENWFKGNKLNPYKSQDKPFPMIAYHGSFIDNPIEKIDANKSAEGVHGASGLYLSTSYEDINGYYTNIENPNADVHASIAELIENPYMLIKRFSINVLYPKINKEPYFEDSRDVLNWCKQNISEEKFKNLFLIEKANSDLYDIDEIITRAYLKSKGVIFPFVIKMENPIYCIEENYANNNGLKSTVLKLPEVDEYDNEVSVSNIIENSNNKLNLFINKFNLLESEGNELRASLSNSFWDGEVLICYLNHYINSFDIDSDLNNNTIDQIREIFSDEDRFCISVDPDVLNAESNYIRFRELLSNLNDYEFKEINKIMNNNINLDDDEYGYSVNIYNILKEADEHMLKREIEIILSQIYDGFVYSANSEFTYIEKANLSDEPIFHYVVNNDNNLKYAYNATFTKNKGIMFRRVLENENGKHLEINKIKKIINSFEKKYSGFPKVTICNNGYKNVAYYNKETDEITVFKNNIRKEEDLIKTLYHEYVIHGKIDKYLTGKDRGFLLEVYNYAKDKEDFKKIKNVYGINNPKTLKDKEYLAEEYLAYAAENKLYKKDKVLLGFF